MKQFFIAMTCAVLLSACAANGPAPEARQISAEEAHAAVLAAETARAKAASVGYEWRDTGKFIGQARDLMKEGKHADAYKLAKKAEQQGLLGYAQWQRENARAMNTP